MKLREIMIRSVETVEPVALIREAAAKMKQAYVGMLPVVDKGYVIGVVTDRDLVVRGLSRKTDQITVREAMTPNPICLLPDAEVDLAVEAMKVNHIGRVLVTDETGHLRGVLSAADIAVAFAGDTRVGKLATTLGSSHRKPTALAP